MAKQVQNRYRAVHVVGHIHTGFPNKNCAAACSYNRATAQFIK